MNVEELMREVVERNGSDGFLTARASPAVKVDGQIYSLETPALEEHEGTSMLRDAYTLALKGGGERTPSYTDRVLLHSCADLAPLLTCESYLSHDQLPPQVAERTSPGLSSPVP